MIPFALFTAKLKRLLAQNIAFVTFFLVGVVAYGTTSEYLLERGAPGSGVRSLFDSLWFVMQTITTVGYGDTPVVTFWGRVNAMALMFVGIGILGLFTASVASVLIDRAARRRMGERSTRLKGHVVICNWNAIAEQLVREIVKEKPDVALLAKLEKIPVSGVEFVSGTCLHVEDLKRAGVQHAGSVIILSETIADGDLASGVDAKTILGIMNVKKLNRDVHVVVELLKADSLENAKLAGANEIVVRGTVSAKLLSRGALDPGTIDIVETMLTAESGEEIFEDAIPDWAVGKTYWELVKYYSERSATSIALRGSEGLKVNPPKDTVLREGSVVYIAKSQLK